MTWRGCLSLPEVAIIDCWLIPRFMRVGHLSKPEMAKEIRSWIDRLEPLKAQDELSLGQEEAVDLDLGAMTAGVVPAGCEIANGLSLADDLLPTGGEGEFAELKDFGCGAARGLHIMDDVVDRQRLGFAGGRNQGE